MHIAIASDHAGFELKQLLSDYLTGQGHTVTDLGPSSADSVDYPDYGYRLAESVAAGKGDRGVAICGSGIGISIAANRHPAVRAALCAEPLSAELSRRHNDANVIAFGARLIGPDQAKKCLDIFLATDFEGGRHARRVDKLAAGVNQP